ncbi:hypothetical protein BDQ17DRAFT_1477443 [Cyathus striatus]|nr:hypothetical protein BDQ17DRAFT_1477443 [Cyathus striatus]
MAPYPLLHLQQGDIIIYILATYPHSSRGLDVEQGQELLVPQHSSPSNVEFPRRAISSLQPPTPLGAGFKFGGDGGGDVEWTEGKEEGTSPPPISSWAPISAIPSSAVPSSVGEGGFALAQLQSQSQSPYPPSPSSKPKEIAPDAVVVGIAEFILDGSLSLTGVGCWVVFDPFGVAMRNTRVETVFLFTQSVYLMFSFVIFCFLRTLVSEVYEADGVDKIKFPIVMNLIMLLYVLGMGVMYANHWSLADVSRNLIPSLKTIWRYITGSRHILPDPPPKTPLFKALTNPFVAPLAQRRLAELTDGRNRHAQCGVSGVHDAFADVAAEVNSGRMEEYLRVEREDATGFYNIRTCVAVTRHIGQSPPPVEYCEGPRVEQHHQLIGLLRIEDLPHALVRALIAIVVVWRDIIIFGMKKASYPCWDEPRDGLKDNEDESGCVRDA